MARRRETQFQGDAGLPVCQLYVGDRAAGVQPLPNQGIDIIIQGLSQFDFSHDHSTHSSRGAAVYDPRRDGETQPSAREHWATKSV